MQINDGGVFDKYGLIDQMSAELDLAAEARGILRCNLLGTIAAQLKALKDGLRKEEEARGNGG